MIVMIDSNEFLMSPETVNYVKKIFPESKITHLETGDINVILDDGRRVAIERKSPGDFLSSIADGRLFNQVERMSAFDSYCVVVTGVFRYSRDDRVYINGNITPWNGKAVRAVIIALQMSACPVINSGNSSGYARVVSEFIQFCSKPPEKTQSSSRIVTFPPLTAAENVLVSFPGVGVRRAKALLEFVGGNLCDAIEWGSSIIPLLRDDAKPEFWGSVTVENFRATLGLGNNQIMKVEDLKNE